LSSDGNIVVFLLFSYPQP